MILQKIQHMVYLKTLRNGILSPSSNQTLQYLLCAWKPSLTLKAYNADGHPKLLAQRDSLTFGARILQCIGLRQGKKHEQQSDILKFLRSLAHCTSQFKNPL